MWADLLGYMYTWTILRYTYIPTNVYPSYLFNSILSQGQYTRGSNIARIRYKIGVYKVELSPDLMTIDFQSVIPILRIFDITKADEFYLDYLGFKIDWDHRFDGNTPLYRQISRGNLILHLSEHHGDGSPGVQVRIMMTGVAEFHYELNAKNYRYMRPGLDKGPAAVSQEMGVVDPFGNQIRFCQVDAQNTKP